MNELIVFVRDALSAGHSRAEIRSVLDQAGWPEDEVRDAMSRFAEVPFPLAVPNRRQSGSAREAFLYLVTFVALYTFAISFGAILFGLVDHWIPDPLMSRVDSDSIAAEGMRWSIASIVVSFPLYLILTRMHLRSYVKDPERRTSPVRRWLTYLTLFVAVCVVISTLIALIAGILGGDYASQFILKLFIAMAIAGAVLFYYLWDLRRGEKSVAS
ncbi:MAG TPA: DUF5671 domain-containing protein [Fimbriimonadaceae bacterium]|nr:DUF5671 domain-containing protein [Fimbriimonadaceae bacterium]